MRGKTKKRLRKQGMLAAAKAGMSFTNNLWRQMKREWNRTPRPERSV